MKDTIRARITRIMTGTAHTIVSKIEGLAPEMILEQAINEVDAAVDDVRAELGRVTAQKHHVTRAMSKLNQEHSDLEEQIETALGEGRKDLAEVAVSRQVDIEDQLPSLENQLGDLRSQEAELNQAITGLVAKRHEMENELFAFKEERKRLDAGATPEEGGSRTSPTARADRAEKAFSRVLQDATGVRRGVLRAGDEERVKLLELADLNRKAKIEARLRQLETRKSPES
ncbi:MAG: PspA/IM30 family protein [Puniceicoccaceae bacterium]|nr:MAG: PspA/IM30 family protein [Puniceicoccaceae bacterium]